MSTRSSASFPHLTHARQLALLEISPTTTLSEAKQRLLLLQAEEEALESLLTTPVLEVTLRTGSDEMTIALSPDTSAFVVHELLLSAIDRREHAQHGYQQLMRLRVTEKVVDFDAQQRA